MNNYINVGKVLKPQGLKGEIKCQLQIASDLQAGDMIKLDDSEYKVISARRQKGQVYIKLEGINSIEEAETIRNKEISVLEELLANNEFSIEQLLQCEIIDNNTQDKVGKLLSVDNMPHAPVLKIQNDNNWFLLPFILDVYITEVNIIENYIKVQDWQNFVEVNN